MRIRGSGNQKITKKYARTPLSNLILMVIIRMRVNHSRPFTIGNDLQISFPQNVRR